MTPFKGKYPYKYNNTGLLTSTSVRLIAQTFPRMAGWKVGY